MYSLINCSLSDCCFCLGFNVQITLHNKLYIKKISRRVIRGFTALSDIFYNELGTFFQMA